MRMSGRGALSGIRPSTTSPVPPESPQKLITQPRPQSCSCVLLAWVRSLPPTMKESRPCGVAEISSSPGLGLPAPSRCGVEYSERTGATKMVSLLLELVLLQSGVNQSTTSEELSSPAWPREMGGATPVIILAARRGEGVVYWRILSFDPVERGRTPTLEDTSI